MPPRDILLFEDKQIHISLSLSHEGARLFITRREKGRTLFHNGEFSQKLTETDLANLLNRLSKILHEESFSPPQNSAAV